MTDKTESRRKSLTPGAVPVLVTAALVAAVIASFLVLRSTVQSQERNLLQERADEVTLVLEGALRTIEAQLNRIGAVARYGSPGPQTAGREAKAIIESPGAPNRTVAVMRKQGDKFIVTAAAGPDAQVGDQFDSKTARAANAAIKNPGLQSAGVVQRRGAKLLRIGLGPPATPERHVAVLLTRVNPDQVTNQGADSPLATSTSCCTRHPGLTGNSFC